MTYSMENVIELLYEHNMYWQYSTSSCSVINARPVNHMRTAHLSDTYTHGHTHTNWVVDDDRLKAELCLTAATGLAATTTSRRWAWFWRSLVRPKFDTIRLQHQTKEYVCNTNVLHIISTQENKRQLQSRQQAACTQIGRQPENMPLAGPIHWMGGDIKTKLQMTRVPETKIWSIITGRDK